MHRLGIFLALAVLLCSTTAPVAAGEANCGEGLACLLSCPDNDSQCAFACPQELNPHATNLYADLMLCLAQLCPGNPPNTVCLLQAGAGTCQSQYKICVDDAGCLGTCEGKDCGDDGCGTDCGTCPTGMACDGAGICVPCQPNCAGKECGDNGCGSSCGNCAEGQGCIDNQCIACNPNCAGKECGEDSCGGYCGQCTFSEECTNGLCVGCTPNCSGGKECGDNGCGGMCGACPPGFICKIGFCQEDIPCDANCLNKECGDDGCGGNCGACGASQFCAESGLCTEGDPPDIIEQEFAGDNEAPSSGDSVTPIPGQDTAAPVNGQCPPGYKLFFGECVVDKEQNSGGGDSGGCSASGRGAHASALLLLLALALLAHRQKRNPWTRSRSM